jgi:four helix bundle protein
MLKIGSIINGKDSLKPSISFREANERIKQIKIEELFDLAWQAYSVEWNYGYAWFNLHTGKFESGHECLTIQTYDYLILLRVSEDDYLFKWDEYDEAAEYGKYKDRLSLPDWCELKGIDCRERIRSSVLHDPQRWNEYCQLLDSKLVALSEWYRKHGVMDKSKKSEPKQNDKRVKGEQMGQLKKDNYFLKDFKTLTLYKKAIELEELIDKLIEGFPHDEKYRLTDQLIRCVTSIGANVAESNGGQYAGRERYHLGVAFSSANEVRYWVERAFRKKYIDQMTFERLDNMAQELRRIMVGMFKRLDESA